MKKTDTKTKNANAVSSTDLLCRAVDDYMLTIEKILKKEGLPPIKSKIWESVNDQGHYMTFAQNAISDVDVGNFPDHGYMLDVYIPEMKSQVSRHRAICKIREEMVISGLTADDLA